MLRCSLCALLCLVIAVRGEEEFHVPEPSGPVHFVETFQNKADWESRWIQSEAKKDDTDDEIAKYDGQWSLEAAEEKALNGDMGMAMKDKAKHYAISAKLDHPFVFDKKPLIVQYEVKLQNGMDCGGSYLKLVSDSSSLDLAKLTDKTPYSIMFGPDNCGYTNKIHFIFRHKKPNGKIEEKHMIQSTENPDIKDKKTHLLTLIVRPDNTFSVMVDRKQIKSGSLLEDFEPAVNPPKEIDDPEDKKPKDWDEREKIPDPTASKPDDWDEDAPAQIEDADADKPDDWLDDEPLYVPDPDAERPEDWNDEEDGEYEAPQVANPKCEKASGCGEWKRPMKPNPEYKGKWSAPMIDNPDYKGIWAPRKIPNPDYFEDLEPFKMIPIGAVAVEVWTMTAGQLFDNLIITDDESVASSFADVGFEAKRSIEETSVKNAATNFITGLFEMAAERPYLWVVYAIVVLILPVILFVACCIPSKKPDQAARAKKTDEPQPDDAPAAGEEEEVEEEEEAAEGDNGDDAGPDGDPEPDQSEEAAAAEGLSPPAGDTADLSKGGSPRRSPRQRSKKKPRLDNN